MKTQSEMARLRNAVNAKLTGGAFVMYMAGKVKLCRAVEVSSRANGGKGWVKR